MSLLFKKSANNTLMTAILALGIFLPVSGAWALEYKGATGNISRSADTLTDVNNACNGLYTGSRAATMFEVMTLHTSGATVSTTALVSPKALTNFQTQWGTEGGGSDEYATFADGVFVLEGPQIGSTCHASTSSSTRGVAYSSSGATILTCGSDRPWHCVAGSIDSSLPGSGDGLGNHTAAQNVNMSGHNVTNAGAYFHSSDALLKTGIEKLSGFDILQAISGYSYSWKDSGESSVGVLAQEVEKVLPNAVFTDEKTGLKSVDYDQLIAPMIEAIKELKAENEEIKTELKLLKDEKIEQ